MSIYYKIWHRSTVALLEVAVSSVNTMAPRTKKKTLSLTRAMTTTPSARSSNRTGMGRNRHRGIHSNMSELLEISNFKQKHYTTRIYLHVKVTINPCNPSSEIAVVPCPYLHCELKELSQNLSFEQIKERILSAVASELFVQKHGDKLQYDSTTGVIGWMGQRDLDENPKKALKGKASFEIASTDEWKLHVKKYATKYVSESERRKDLIIDLGIALYKNDTCKTNNKSSSNSATKKSNSTSAKKRKMIEQPFVFRAPYQLVIHVCKPVEMEIKHDERREKTGGVDSIGTVTINFDEYVLERNCYHGSVSDSDEDDDDISIIENVETDDVIKTHIYEGIRHTLAHKILDDPKFKEYHESIGKKVRILYAIDRTLFPIWI